MNVADEAARDAGVRVSELDDIHELQAASRLFADVWQTGDQLPVGPELLRAFAHAGGYVAGAFLDEALVGASAGFRGELAGRPVLHSHVTGVAPGLQSRGMGLALKLHQGAWAADRDLAVTWTFDPLVRRNAWFNLTKLGAIGIEYHINFYGPLNDRINRGDETDRCLVLWEVGAERVASPLAISTQRVETPDDIEVLRVQDPEKARWWRRAVREAMAPALETGYRATAMTRDGWYVLERAE